MKQFSFRVFQLSPRCCGLLLEETRLAGRTVHFFMLLQICIRQRLQHLRRHPWIIRRITDRDQVGFLHRLYAQLFGELPRRSFQPLCVSLARPQKMKPVAASQFCFLGYAPQHFIVAQ